MRLEYPAAASAASAAQAANASQPVSGRAGWRCKCQTPSAKPSAASLTDGVVETPFTQ
jgi:hypothetical protein